MLTMLRVDPALAAAAASGSQSATVIVLFLMGLTSWTG
jgi:hypothetical protein